MRPATILKKVKKYKKWKRRPYDAWCNLEIVTIKTIHTRREKNKSFLISLEEADFLWHPKWLWKHYEPIL